MISHKIIEYTLEKEAKYINLELLKGISQDRKDSFVLRNWSYFELQTMIKQKGEKYGIEVRTVDPYHTSKDCALCGETGERESQAVFKCLNEKCENYNVEINADKNAAMNIAKSSNFVTETRDCRFFKKSA